MVNLLCCCVNWDAWNAIATTCTCIAAAVIAWFQYKTGSNHQKEATRSKILADYNWHYMQNNSIRVVIRALIDKKFGEDKVHIYDIEIFLRFFEELYLLIHSENRMKPEIARYMFSYYAILAWDSDELWGRLASANNTSIEAERSSEDWTMFRSFVEEMKTINSKSITI